MSQLDWGAALPVISSVSMHTDLIWISPYQIILFLFFLLFPPETNSVVSVSSWFADFSGFQQLQTFISAYKPPNGVKLQVQKPNMGDHHEKADRCMSHEHQEKGHFSTCERDVQLQCKWLLLLLTSQVWKLHFCPNQEIFIEVMDHLICLCLYRRDGQDVHGMQLYSGVSLL